MRLPLIATLLLAASSIPAFAAESRNPTGAEVEQGEKGVFRSWMDTGRAAPGEGAVKYPELATLKDWVKIRMPHAKSFDFLIARDSVSIGEQDEIVRYVVVAKSKTSSARNVRFEGIDCPSAQYRTYAFGNAEGGWSESSSAEWKLITSNTHNAWQAELVDEFCQLGGPYKLPVILNNLGTEPIPNDCLDCATKRTHR